MKVVALAEGFELRISKELHLKPKIIIEFCGKLILLHIMKTNIHYSFTDFIDSPAKISIKIKNTNKTIYLRIKKIVKVLVFSREFYDKKNN